MIKSPIFFFKMNRHIKGIFWKRQMAPFAPAPRKKVKTLSKTQ
ncbi:hypothetical protein C943_02179 [Mariniradius saccharolyticus AK6]|uniref:Uncharacterized protein n=1 Tax=Mariniradius saccharolyticus AK6 TaxID=1239962 RepID=M7X994_9BACT|nr:hypothetical protein C943_02179 [Mariniradius saccharolyticus AK6]